jgi:ribokinase
VPPSSRIAVVGSLNMDLVTTVPRAPGPGETVMGRTLAVVPGGKGANQAVACARLGGQVAMIGRVGADEFGEQLRQALVADGVSVEHVVTEPTATTGTAVILVDDSAQNRIVIIPGANAMLRPAYIESAAKLITTAALLVVQLEIPIPTVECAIAQAAGAGVPVMLNPAPAQELPADIWPRVDYLIPNAGEATLLTGIDVTDLASATLAARKLLERGVRNVLITLGADGVLVCDDTGTHHHAAIPVQAIDTTAAGDSFVGALAAALVNGFELDSAVKFATAAAALSVTRAGAQTSIPHRKEVLEFVRTASNSACTFDVNNPKSTLS